MQMLTFIKISLVMCLAVILTSCVTDDNYYSEVRTYHTYQPQPVRVVHVVPAPSGYSSSQTPPTPTRVYHSESGYSSSYTGGSSANTSGYGSSQTPPVQNSQSGGYHSSQSY
jgi:hypothetical protein